MARVIKYFASKGVSIMINPQFEYSRHRDRYGLSQIGTTSLVQRNYAGTVSDPWRITSTVTTPGVVSSGDYEEMYDVVTPDFTKRMRQGGIINSPMEREHTIYCMGRMNVDRSCINRSLTTPYTYSGYRQQGSSIIGNKDASGTWPNPTEPQIDGLNNRISEVVTDMWSKVSVKQNDTIASLGEMKDTVYGLISIFTKAIEIFRDLRRLRLKQALRKTMSEKALMEEYLFTRYALRPLMYEAQSYVDVLCNKTLLKRQTYRSFRTLDATPVTTENVTLFSSGAGTLIGTQYATRNVEIRGGVLCTLDIDNNIGRWGFTEPLEGIWELVPFSFIVDWFFNIGKFIASWTPNFGIQKLASWIVVTDMTTLTSTVVSGTNSPSYNFENYRYVSGSYSKVILRKYRYPEPSRPYLPSFVVNMNWLKSLDIYSILSLLISYKNDGDPVFKGRRARLK